MASPTLPWISLWRTMWGLIPTLATKDNQTSYPWLQCILAIGLLKKVQAYYKKTVLAVTDSWFGNNGPWAPLGKGADGKFHLLSRMRTNITLYDFTPLRADGEKRRGRTRKYGDRFGSVDECAARWQAMAKSYTVFLYGKKREVQAYSHIVMLKTMKCPVNVVWVYRKTRYVTLMTS